MNLFKEFLKTCKIGEAKYKIIAEDPKDDHCAKVLTNMLNYMQKNENEALYFCCNGHQFNERSKSGKCPECENEFKTQKQV